MKAKVILIASFILSTFMSVAQPGGGMGGPGGGMGGGPEGGMGPGGMASVSPLAAAGYFEIDSKEALKKMKIKDKDRSKAAAALFNTYQQNYDELTATFGAEIEAVSNSQKEMSEARESISSQEEMRAMMSKIREKITATTETIKPEMVKYHEALNSGLKATLT